MSITARLWTDEDLLNLASDDNLLTIFFNCIGCRSKKEIQFLNKLWDKRKNYCVRFASQTNEERFQTFASMQPVGEVFGFIHEDDNDTTEDDNVISVYGVSDDSLKWFIKHQYPLAKIESIIEIVSYTREVSL